MPRWLTGKARKAAIVIAAAAGIFGSYYSGGKVEENAQYRNNAALYHEFIDSLQKVLPNGSEIHSEREARIVVAALFASPVVPDSLKKQFTDRLNLATAARNSAAYHLLRIRRFHDLADTASIGTSDSAIVEKLRDIKENVSQLYKARDELLVESNFLRGLGLHLVYLEQDFKDIEDELNILSDRLYSFSQDNAVPSEVRKLSAQILDILSKNSEAAPPAEEPANDIQMEPVNRA